MTVGSRQAAKATELARMTGPVLAAAHGLLRSSEGSSARKLLAGQLAVILTLANSPALLAQAVAGGMITDLQQGRSITLRDAVLVAMRSNPEIIQAQMNKEAIEFERKQAQGRYVPQVDVEGSYGARRLKNDTRRTLEIADDVIFPLEFQSRGTWDLIDFGKRRFEVKRQTARVDGAEMRALERRETIALQIARQYLNIVLQQRVFAASQDNVAFHRALVDDLAAGVKAGAISIADQQQAQERLQAAVVREIEAQQRLEDAKIALRRLTGLDVSQGQVPPSLTNQLPASVTEAVELARINNPIVKEAEANLDAVSAFARSVKSDLYPTIGVDMTGRAGKDIDGFKGNTTDVTARAVVRWNLFSGGINQARYQEQVRRISEARSRLDQVSREAEEDVRTAWNAMTSQSWIIEELENQSKNSDDLLASYRALFNIGRRSLLDVLDAQNTRNEIQTRLESARFSQLFAEYQTLATTNRLLNSLDINSEAEINSHDERSFGPPAPFGG